MFHSFKSKLSCLVTEGNLLTQDPISKKTKHGLLARKERLTPSHKATVEVWLSMSTVVHFLRDTQQSLHWLFCLCPRILHQMLGHYFVLPLGDEGTLQTRTLWEKVRLLEACSWKQYWDPASSSLCFQPPQGAYLSIMVPATKPCTTTGPKVRRLCKWRLRPLKPWAKVNTHSMKLTCLKCFIVVATGELNLGNTEYTTCKQSLQQTPTARQLLITVFWTITCPPSTKTSFC